jgi:antitoxin component of RelBE/YafQ-DinJ toxin-antitoxin module
MDANRVMSIISYFVTDLDSITTDSACETLTATQNIQTMTLTIPKSILLFVKQIGQEKWIPAQTLILSYRSVAKGR